MYANERLAFVAACLLAVTIALMFGRLQLMSLQLRDQTFIYGRYRELRALKAGIEQALSARAGASKNSSRAPT